LQIIAAGWLACGLQKFFSVKDNLMMEWWAQFSNRNRDYAKRSFSGVASCMFGDL